MKSKKYKEKERKLNHYGYFVIIAQLIQFMENVINVLLVRIIFYVITVF